MSNNIEDLIHNIGLYKEIQLELDDYSFLQTIIDGEYKTEFFCPECETNRVFVSMENPIQYKQKSLRMTLPGIPLIGNSNEELIVNGEDTIREIKKKKMNAYMCNLLGFIQINMVCTMNSEHIISFNFRIKENQICKIGQYPSLADIEGKTVAYKKELGSYYSELNKAIGLYSHGIGIGSFVYLRRIIEFLIEETRQEAMGDLNWNNQEFNEAHFDEKIKKLKNHLPEFLVNNRTHLYSIISKGIHELEEDECKKLFPLLQKSIEMILEKRITMKKQKEQEKELSSLLGKEYEKLT